MRKIISIIMMAVSPFVCIHANATAIFLQVEYIDPSVGQGNNPRGPIVIPNVGIEDHSLQFNTPCDGCTLRLVNEDGDIAYSTIIPSNTVTLELPSYLEGEYEIQIIRDNLCFYGYITLQ